MIQDNNPPPPSSPSNPEGDQDQGEPVFFIDDIDAGFGYVAYDDKSAHQWLQNLLDSIEEGEEPRIVRFKRRNMTQAELDALPEI